MLTPKETEKNPMTYVVAALTIVDGKVQPVAALRVDETNIITARQRGQELLKKHYQIGNKNNRFLAVVEIEHPGFSLHSETYKKAIEAAKAATEDMLMDRKKWKRDWRIKCSLRTKPSKMQVIQEFEHVEF